MTFHNVLTHQPQREITQPHFFILSKGKNAGKPLKESCPNCFLITVKTEEETENLYWIAYFLWKANFWHQYQIGSVIPFLRIHDFKKRFSGKVNEMLVDFELHKKQIQALRLLEQKEEQLLQNIVLINEMRRVILSHYCLKT